MVVSRANKPFAEMKGGFRGRGTEITEKRTRIGMKIQRGGEGGEGWRIARFVADETRDARRVSIKFLIYIRDQARVYARVEGSRRKGATPWNIESGRGGGGRLTTQTWAVSVFAVLPRCTPARTILAATEK